MEKMPCIPLRIEADSIRAADRGAKLTGFTRPQLLRAAITAGLPIVIERNRKVTMPSDKSPRGASEALDTRSL